MNPNAMRQEISTILRSKGLRATSARIAVWQALADCAGPVSHQELTNNLSDMGLDKSTIFRGLQDMTEAGLLHRMELGDHVWRYELVREGSQYGPREDEHSHPHLLCTDCGSVLCLNHDDVSIEISPELGKVVDVFVKGQCKDCGGTQG